jgi:hypothetical protein
MDDTTKTLFMLSATSDAKESKVGEYLKERAAGDGRAPEENEDEDERPCNPSDNEEDPSSSAFSGKSEYICVTSTALTSDCDFLPDPSHCAPRDFKA